MKKEKKQNKKKKETRVSLKNGICFQPGIDMTVSSPVISFFPLVQIAIAVVSSLSVLYMLPAFLNSENGSFSGSYEITNGTTVFMVCFFTAIAAMFSNSREKFLKVVGFSYLILNAVYILFHINSVVNGFMSTVNIYTKCASFAKPLFAQKAANATEGELEMFLLAFAFLLTILAAFGSIFHINFPIEFLATFPIFELMTFWGMKFDDDYTWTIIGMLFSWMIVLSLSLINHKARSKNSTSTFAVHSRRKTYYMTSERIKGSFFGLMTAAIVIVSLTVFIVTLAFIHHNTGDVRNDRINKLRVQISNGFRDLSRDISEQASIMSSPTPGRGQKMIGGTNGGRLGLYDELKFYGKSAMRVTTPAFQRAIYLRGYAAEVYEDNSWTPIKNDKDTESIFEKQYGSFVLDYDYIHNYYENVPGNERIQMSIDPINCSEDIIYAPYGAHYSQIDIIDEQRYDGIASPQKKKQGDDYELTSISLGDPGDDWGTVVSKQEAMKTDSGEQAALKIYDDSMPYGNEVFAYVPEEAIPSLDRIIEQAGVEPGMNISSMNYALRNYMRENGYTYDLKPGVTPEGEEFVSYFLDVQKKGYCTYYASAGVMLMRRLGVPARYVEGYIIEPSQYSADKSYITVSDRCAHAWCEVFIDGCGWYPLEFTPGYESDNPNLTDYDKNVKTEPQYKQTVSRPEKKDNSSSRSSKSSSSRSDSSRSSSSSKAGAASSAQSSGGSKTGGSKSGSGTGSGDGGRKPDNVEDTKIDLMQLAYIMLTLGFIAVVLLTTAVRRKNNLARLHRQNNSPDNRKSVISCYTTFLEYAKLLGLDRNGNLTDVQLTVKVSEMLKEKMPEMCGSFIELSDTALLAYMSDQEISDEESTLSRKTLSELRRRIYELLNLPQKLFAKWVLGLY